MSKNTDLLLKTVYYVSIVTNKMYEILYKRKSQMEKFAAIEHSLACQMFSDVKEAQQIAQALRETNELHRLYEHIEQLQQLFAHLYTAVPAVELPESKQLRIQQRAAHVHTLQVGNVVHVPFTAPQPPMYIVLHEANAKQLQQLQFQLLALIELCALEQRDCIIVAGHHEPIIFTRGIVSYASFMRLLAITDVSHFCSFQQFVKQSIAAPFVPGSDIYIVAGQEQPLQLDAQMVDTLLDLKHIFNSSIKAIVKAPIEDTQLTQLLDAVFIDTAQ